MTETDEPLPDFPSVGSVHHERAIEYRRIALGALANPETYDLDPDPEVVTGFALVHAVLAVEAAVEELSSWALHLTIEMRKEARS